MTAAIPVFQPFDIIDEDSLADEITLLAGQINAGHYRLLKMIAEFDTRKGWSGGGTVRSCAHWLNWKCGIALGAAREKVRVAHCLADLPLIDGAFARGEISYSKVRAMTRVATAQNEAYLLMIARHGTATHMEKLVGKFRNVQSARKAEGESEGEVKKEEQESRKLFYYQDEEGMWVIHARLPPEEGSLVVKALEAVATPVQETKREELGAERELTKGKISAEISEEGAPEGNAPEDNDNGEISAEIFSEAISEAASFEDLVEHTRADALVTVAEHFLATCGESEQFQALKGSERCQIMLHVDINTLRQHALTEDVSGAGAHECCHLDEKPWISPDTARRLACDASLVTVLEDENGQVLNIGRRSRTVPAHIRRALSIRDKTCCVPGCTQSRYIDAHHIVHWADGGETSLDNLVSLCRACHRKIHQGVFSIRMEPTAPPHGQPQLLFETPSGERLTACFPQFPPEAVAGAARALAQMAPAVDAGTCVTHWRGERCDYGMAVDGLLGRE